MRYYWSLLDILYKDYVTDEDIRKMIQATTGEFDEFLTLFKKQKLKLFGHNSMSSDVVKAIHFDKILRFYYVFKELETSCNYNTKIL